MLTIKRASIHRMIWEIKRTLGMTSTQKVFKKLENRGINIGTLRALEVFGGSGDLHTKDYAHKVYDLAVWEIDSVKGDLLIKNLPNAKIKITDSYKEIKHTSERYDLIVVDNVMQFAGNHCEHFDLFPDIFSIASNSSIIIINVIPEVDAKAIRLYPALFNKEQLERRKVFYRTNWPEKISFDKMIEVYEELVRRNNFELEWYFFKKRTFVYYLVLKIRRSSI